MIFVHEGGGGSGLPNIGCHVEIEQPNFPRGAAARGFLVPAEVLISVKGVPRLIKKTKDVKQKMSVEKQV